MIASLFELLTRPLPGSTEDEPAEHKNSGHPKQKSVTLIASPKRPFRMKASRAFVGIWSRVIWLRMSITFNVLRVPRTAENALSNRSAAGDRSTTLLCAMTPTLDTGCYECWAGTRFLASTCEAFEQQIGLGGLEGVGLAW
jgi:hypothetical protein